MLKKLSLLTSFILLFACDPQQGASTSPGELSQVESTSVTPLIAYERFTLSNGLTVILHRDTSDPIVAMSTLVHVGSSREKPGRTGFAHLFEHMSFNDSENVPKGANRKMLPELGGTRNGGTWSDGTVYYEVVPKDAFEKLMWIDSDRLGYMINTVKEGTLEREKQVVKNEKRQSADNRPYGHTGRVIRKAIYPQGHPYNWTVIGELEDLQRATLADVREFYDRFYVPANATLAIAGDIDIEETKRLVQMWFGEIPAAPAEPDPKPQPVKLHETKRLVHLDNFAKVPELRITFPTVERFHPDAYALSALGSILSDGKNAPLYKEVVETQKLSSSVGAYQSSGEVAGTFTISTRANPGTDLDQVHESIAKALEKFEGNGFRNTDLARIKASSEMSFYRNIQSVLDKAQLLAEYQEFAGDPSFYEVDQRREQAVTKDDIVRVYERYIKGKHAIVTSFVPKSQPKLAVQGSATASVEEEEIVSGAEKTFIEDDAADYARTSTLHDRSEPPLGPKPEVSIPQIWQQTTTNGIRVYGIEQNELPLVEFHLRIESGQQLDTPSLAGTAKLCAELMNEGTQSKSPLELEDAIELLGSRIHVSASKTTLDISGSTLAKNFDATMSLISEMLLEPRWEQSEFDRLKTASLAQIEQRSASPTAIARQAFNRQIYGPQHIGGQAFGGELETVNRITLDAVKQWYATNLSPKLASVHVTGAVTPEQVSGSLSTMEQNWAPKYVAIPDLRPARRDTKPAVYFVDVPGAKQSVLYVGKASLPGGDERYYFNSVANNRLGADMSSRLTQVLRIQKGYTYGARSRFTRPAYEGTFYASTQVRSNVTLESLEVLRDLIRNYKATFGQAELETTKNLLSKAATRRFETIGRLNDVLSTMSRHNLPADYIQRQSQQLAQMSLADIHVRMDEEIQESEMIYVIVGDAETQLAPLEKLGYGKAVLLDHNGDIKK